MDVFQECSRINDLFLNNQHDFARNELIRLLDKNVELDCKYDYLINNLVRQAGLYPYIKESNSDWTERYVSKAFATDIGGGQSAVLHREQSKLLSRLLDGENLAVSAPTSFGKSFIIDSFLAIKKPKNVVIIVPTIALADETRRRLQKKFSTEYRIITTPDVKLATKNILIFPQERALGYSTLLKKLDILIVDEFYKASDKFDKERATPLLRAILRLSKIARQRYFLAPNITSLGINPFTKGMEFVQLGFNTVVLEEHHLYKGIKSKDEKNSVFSNLLNKVNGKSLVYSGSYAGIKRSADIAKEVFEKSTDKKLSNFAVWLELNYGAKWSLPGLVRHGIGIHNGQLHRSLSQLQVKLFELTDGLHTLISTSSIIEGVNTSAENVILFSNKNGSEKLDYFTYRNIVGRSGRMFRHFVGKVYILEPPPEKIDTQLEIGITEDILPELDELEFKADLTQEQISKMISYREEMSEMLGEDVFPQLQAENSFLTNDFQLLRKICADIRNNPRFWAGIAYLNTNNPESWGRIIYKIINIDKSGWGKKFTVIVDFIKILSRNWDSSIPQMLKALSQHEVTVDDFFQLERTATYRMASLLNDVNVIHRRMVPGAPDISPFVGKLSHAFLPTVVYQLEEYGLPRMLSKRIHKHRILDLTDSNLSLHQALAILRDIGRYEVQRHIGDLDEFDTFVINHFFDGIDN